MRGEYRPKHLVWREGEGLPPHAWGIPQPSSYIFISVGITPTCVGNTRFRL